MWPASSLSGTVQVLLWTLGFLLAGGIRLLKNPDNIQEDDGRRPASLASRQACSRVDNDFCLQEVWGSYASCAKYVGDAYTCDVYGKDLQRCCPVSCGTPPVCDAATCNTLVGKGYCTYPIPQAPTPAPTPPTPPPSCAAVDNDFCLQEVWGSKYICAEYAADSDSCEGYGKDLQRCCPVSCGTPPVCDAAACNTLSGKGYCTYPIPQAPTPAPPPTPLIFTPPPRVCVDGYQTIPGDIFGWGQLSPREGGHPVDSCGRCAEWCTFYEQCGSYECSVTELRCNLNFGTEPSSKPFRDFAFCSKIGATTQAPPKQDMFPDFMSLLNQFENVSLRGEACGWFFQIFGCACGGYNQGNTAACQLPPIDTSATMGGYACGQYGSWFGCAAWSNAGPPDNLDPGLMLPGSR